MNATATASFARPSSPARSGSTPSTSPPTHTSSPRSSSPSPNPAGSPPDSPFALSATPAPANHTCSSASAPRFAEAGLKVRDTTTANLVNELVEAVDERQLARVLNRYSKVDLLCLDELGYLELDKAGAKLLFQILTDREERGSIAVASNAPFSEWPQTFADKRLCSAILDRLT